MAADVRLAAPFESEKHLVGMLACDFRAKAYLSIRCEAKMRASAPEMLWSQKGVVK